MDVGQVAEAITENGMNTPLETGDETDIIAIFLDEGEDYETVKYLPPAFVTRVHYDDELKAVVLTCTAD